MFIDVVVVISLGFGTVALALVVRTIPMGALLGGILGYGVALPFGFISSLILVDRMGGQNYQAFLYLIILLLSCGFKNVIVRKFTQ